MKVCISSIEDYYFKVEHHEKTKFSPKKLNSALAKSKKNKDNRGKVCICKGVFLQLTNIKNW